MSRKSLMQTLWKCDWSLVTEAAAEQWHASSCPDCHYKTHHDFGLADTLTGLTWTLLASISPPIKSFHMSVRPNNLGFSRHSKLMLTNQTAVVGVGFRERACFQRLFKLLMWECVLLTCLFVLMKTEGSAYAKEFAEVGGNSFQFGQHWTGFVKCLKAGLIADIYDFTTRDSNCCEERATGQWRGYEPPLTLRQRLVHHEYKVAHAQNQ